MALITSFKILMFPNSIGCVSNINCFPHTVDVFDSIGGFSVNSTSLKNQIATILRTPTNNKLY